jgi:hypothetical protein
VTDETPGPPDVPKWPQLGAALQGLPDLIAKYVAESEKPNPDFYGSSLAERIANGQNLTDVWNQLHNVTLAE